MPNIIANGATGSPGFEGSPGTNGGPGNNGQKANCNWIDCDCATRVGPGRSGGHGGTIVLEADNLLPGIQIQAKGGAGGVGGNGEKGGDGGPEYGQH